MVEFWKPPITATHDNCAHRTCLQIPHAPATISRNVECCMYSRGHLNRKPHRRATVQA